VCPSGSRSGATRGADVFTALRELAGLRAGQSVEAP
jgi:hypothetical protein